MEQFALLRQKSQDGKKANNEFLAQLKCYLDPGYLVATESETGSTTDISDSKVWDVPLKTVKATSQPLNIIEGCNNDERRYFNAVSGTKRGDSALLDHLNHANRSKRVRTHERTTEIDGVKVSERNVRFNDRLNFA